VVILVTMTEISSLADLTQISAKAVANHSFSNFPPEVSGMDRSVVVSTGSK
jgi:hypothetical protein